MKANSTTCKPTIRASHAVTVSHSDCTEVPISLIPAWSPFPRSHWYIASATGTGVGVSVPIFERWQGRTQANYYYRLAHPLAEARVDWLIPNPSMRSSHLIGGWGPDVSPPHRKSDKVKPRYERQVGRTRKGAGRHDSMFLLVGSCEAGHEAAYQRNSRRCRTRLPGTNNLVQTSPPSPPPPCNWKALHDPLSPAS